MKLQFTGAPDRCIPDYQFKERILQSIHVFASCLVGPASRSISKLVSRPTSRFSECTHMRDASASIRNIRASASPSSHAIRVSEKRRVECRFSVPFCLVDSKLNILNVSRMNSCHYAYQCLHSQGRIFTKLMEDFLCSEAIPVEA